MMNTSRFLQRLLAELPLWKERGWVSDEGAQAIVDHLRAEEGGTHRLSYAVAILGVLLLGAGIITWFAANWQEIGKLGKLAILVGSLYAAYGIAAWLLQEARYPRIGQAVLLLGVILFGANIMLIGQIYHIDAHYPDGVLLWALGGLLTAYLLKSAPALVATMVLGLLWSALESIGFEHVHWWFLLLWCALIPAIHRWRWQGAFGTAVVVLCLWSLITIPALDVPDDTGAYLYVVQLYFLLYVAAFIGGLLLDTWWPSVRFAPAIQMAGIFGALLFGYFLSFPDLQSGHYEFSEQLFRAPASADWRYLNLGAVLLVAALSAWHFSRTRAYDSMRFLAWGRVIMAGGIGVLVVSLYVDGIYGGPLAVAFNLLYFAALVWLVFAGMHLGDRLLVNLAFYFFALTLLTRYFDTFWTLLNRSLFFMLGGAMLIVGGYLLERQRRRITAEMSAREEPRP